MFKVTCPKTLSLCQFKGCSTHYCAISDPLKMNLQQTIEAPYEREILRLQKIIEEKEKEIERLKGLLKKLFIQQYSTTHPIQYKYNLWEQFKKENNL